ncbi:MAG: hypothetical protein LH660_21815 [Phormidesmis sp. CAN_BIN36]|nr:hypothetical protein [Phormidesmis sp. CAN_BIN36]
MPPSTSWLLRVLGFLSIAVSPPSHAAVLRQNFELKVTRSDSLSLGDQPSVAAPI